jgi:hypothetical protein
MHAARRTWSWATTLALDRNRSPCFSTDGQNRAPSGSDQATSGRVSNGRCEWPFRRGEQRRRESQSRLQTQETFPQSPRL